MPFYSVIVEGGNLQIPGGAGGPTITGFFTMRVVHAPSQEAAEGKAMESVRRDWLKPEYASQPSAGSLKLAISEVSPSGLLQWLRASNKGHTFFSEPTRGEA